jgi:AcrR family transcriptional regulator
MITAAAAALFAERGFAAVGMEDIANAVGVTPGALYRHFPGKAAILSAVVDDIVGRFLVEAERAEELMELGAIAPWSMPQAVAERALRLHLSDPSLLAAYVRERDRVDGDALRQRESRLWAVWQRAILAARPELDATDALVRVRAVLGGGSVMSARTPLVDPRRVETLLTAAAVGVMRSPRPRTVPPPRRDVGGWRPPTARRDEILSAALGLFRERGFHGTGVDEIGEAVGLTGSGIYRSYRTKADILLDAYDRAGSRVAVGVEDALAASDGPLDALTRLARSYSSVALDNVDLIVVTSREGEAIPEGERPRLSRRRQALRATWVSVLRAIRPELSEPEARLLVRGVFPLATSVALLVPRIDVPCDQVVELILALLLPPSWSPS